jgi:hypothetical protein
MAERDETTGMNRRDLLKKGAVGGALVWTAPVILSRASAGAQEINGSPGDLCRPSITMTHVAAFFVSSSGTITVNVSSTAVCAPVTQEPCTPSETIRWFDVSTPSGTNLLLPDVDNDPFSVIVNLPAAPRPDITGFNIQVEHNVVCSDGSVACKRGKLVFDALFATNPSDPIQNDVASFGACGGNI